MDNMDFEYLWDLVDDAKEDNITPATSSSVSSDFSNSSRASSNPSPSTVSSSSSSSSSSAAAPSSQFDVLSLYHEILRLEGFPVDSVDWATADLADKAAARRYLVRLFLEKGCPSVGHGSRNPTVQQGIRELSWVDVIEQLANLGASCDDRNCRGDTAVHLGLAHDACDEPVFDSLLESFLDTATENLANSDGLTLLHVACAKASADTVRRLVERFPRGDINAQVDARKRVPFAGYTPLHFAVAFGKHENAKLLLSLKCNLYARDRLCNTPLHLALYHGDTEMVDLILMCDQKYENCVNNFGLSHLMVACAGSKYSVVEKYLEVAALQRKLPASATVQFSVMQQTSQPFAGFTPLHFAALHGNHETVGLLLKRGASTCAMTSEKHTPLALARMNDNREVCRVMQRHSEGRGYQQAMPPARAMMDSREKYCAWSIFNPFGQRVGVDIAY